MAVRLIGAAVLTAIAVLVGVVVFLNQQSTANDPLLALTGFTLLKNPGSSMEPTMHRNAVFLVSIWPYRNADPAPGDVVVFHYPLDPATLLVKRVIAGGGATVEIVNGITNVNGEPIDEPYVDALKTREYRSQAMNPIRVPAHEFFLMGDNRDQSDDSRHWGPLPRNQIIGKVDSASMPIKSLLADGS